MPQIFVFYTIEETMQDSQFYPNVNSNPNFPEIEEKVLKSWEEQSIFKKSVENRDFTDETSNEYVFFDGPPFANGLPHYGHLLTGYVKDSVPRYQTMRGKKVRRKFGWDCHGLPAEMGAEKELGIAGRLQILDYGIEKFNNQCRRSVLKYTGEWKEFVNRQARWVDLDNDYKTMDLSYTESVLWAFKQLWDKGLIYEGHRVVPYSWACESTLSNFETRLDNSYRKGQDPAVTVKFDLEPLPGDNLPTQILAWTTTPWTLPSNQALGVGKNIEYVIVEKDGMQYILSSNSLTKYENELAGAKRVRTLNGGDLVGRVYKPIFPFFKDDTHLFRILPADFVTIDEGTGVVHLCSGFGEEDFIVCQAHGIPVFCPVDNSGCFTDEVPPYKGQMVLDANKAIIRDLKQAGIIVRHETYEHNRPYCWRTDTPLIYKAVRSWYLRVTDIRDRMVELNQQINWMPEHIRDGQFGKWLENARDWNISRNRFWGAPIPVWKSDNPNYPRTDVYGSLDEIERDFGVRPTDLHRPFIEQLVRPNPDDPTGQSMMRWVEEVFDCWFESGSMPFAQVHYPFENKEWFEKHFPGDFVVEYVAQTRGWFYTLMILGTALFDSPPFLNCVCHGVVLDEHGQKLSKRLQNYPNPETVFNTYGSDALRWFLISSPILRGGDLLIDREGKAIGDVIRRIINPVWNAYYFFCLYANNDGIKAEYKTDSSGILDRYILAKTRVLIETLTQQMDAYDLSAACATVANFIDALNNWYIRRSRDRFWVDGYSQDKQDAYDTLFTVLTTLCQVMSPILPLITEEIYRGLTANESVHLTDWPDASFFENDLSLIREMDLVREICSTALSIRKEKNLRVRLPLTSLTFAGQDAQSILKYSDLIQSEVNVKSLHLSLSQEDFGTFELQVHGNVGNRLRSAMQQVLQAARGGNWHQHKDGSVVVADQLLSPGEFTLRLKTSDGVACQVMDSSKGLVALDVNVTVDLYQEGVARDLVRLIQMTRKDVGLAISDYIEVDLTLSEDLTSIVMKHQNYICHETLINTLTFNNPSSKMHQNDQQLNGETIRISLMKAKSFSAGIISKYSRPT
jgi:isoleucyl-tRNA synthetase